MEGVRQGQDDRVRGLQRELKGDLYKDADVRHKDMLITLRVYTHRPRGLGGIVYVCTIRPQRWLPRIWKSTTECLIGRVIFSRYSLWPM